jgi:hypothetical protein
VNNYYKLSQIPDRDDGGLESRAEEDGSRAEDESRAEEVASRAMKK